MSMGFLIEDVGYTASVGAFIPLCIIGSLIALFGVIKKQTDTEISTEITEENLISNKFSSETARFTFGLRWGFLTATGRIVAIFLGFIIVTPLTVKIATLINQPTYSYTCIILDNGFRGLLIGLTVGVVQWRLLRKWLQGAFGWFTILVVGETLGLAFTASVIKFIGVNVLRTGNATLVVSSYIGLLIALAQGDILRHNNYQRKLWLITVPFIWVLTQYFSPIGYFSMASTQYSVGRETLRTSLLTTGIIFLTISALLQGVIEGFVITQILKQKNASA